MPYIFLQLIFTRQLGIGISVENVSLVDVETQTKAKQPFMKSPPSWRLFSAGLLLLGGCAAPSSKVAPLSAPVAVQRPAPLNLRPANDPMGATTLRIATGDDSALLLGNPSSAATQVDNLLVSRPQFTLSYNRSQGGPNWVAWHLQASDLGHIRRGQFQPDPLLPPEAQIRPNDYRGSGYDRGHQCPSGDRTSTRENNDATFVMSNMLPQAPTLNQKVWAKLENYCRDQGRRGYELYIVAGGEGTVGKIANKINVPASCWKVILILPQGDNDLQRINGDTRVIAVVMPNQDTPEVGAARWAQYLTTLAAVEQVTGYHFFSALPKATRQALIAKKDSGRGSRETGDTGAKGDNTVGDNAAGQNTPGTLSPPAPQNGSEEKPPGLDAGAENGQAASGGAASGGQVWVNTRSGVYHYPGARYYGKTKQGEYMGESAAQAQGYHAAGDGQ